MTLDILYFIDILGLYIVTMTKYRPNTSYNTDIFYVHCHKNQLSRDPEYSDIHFEMHNEFQNLNCHM